MVNGLEEGIPLHLLAMSHSGSAQCAKSECQNSQNILSRIGAIHRLCRFHKICLEYLLFTKATLLTRYHWLFISFELKEFFDFMSKWKMIIFVCSYYLGKWFDRVERRSIKPYSDTPPGSFLVLAPMHSVARIHCGLSVKTSRITFTTIIWEPWLLLVTYKKKT